MYQLTGTEHWHESQKTLWALCKEAQRVSLESGKRNLITRDGQTIVEINGTAVFISPNLWGDAEIIDTVCALASEYPNCRYA